MNTQENPEQRRCAVATGSRHFCLWGRASRKGACNRAAQQFVISDDTPKKFPTCSIHAEIAKRQGWALYDYANMDSCVPKNEREWWAHHKLTTLQNENERLSRLAKMMAHTADNHKAHCEKLQAQLTALQKQNAELAEKLESSEVMRGNLEHAVKAAWSKIDDLEIAIKTTIERIPASGENGELYIVHFDENGEEKGIELVDPLAVIHSMEASLKSALASRKGGQDD